jgi:hypothetical protein
MIADWLRAEVITGLQKLLALRLPGTPPQDAVTGTAQVWLEAIDQPGICWDEALDKPRVLRAFKALFANCERWPVPKNFMQHLGNRDPPRALPPPPMTREEIERNRERVRELVALLARKQRAPKPPTPADIEAKRQEARSFATKKQEN